MEHRNREVIPIDPLTITVSKITFFDTVVLHTRSFLTGIN